MIFRLCRALDVDTARVRGAVLRDGMPDAWEARERDRGGVLAGDERRLLDLYREQCATGEIALDERRIKQITAALAE